MKVAILGLSDATRAEAPWSDSSVEKWGLAWDPAWAHMHRLFEMHDRRLFAKFHDDVPKHEARLREIWVPLYMRRPYKEFSAIGFPFGDVARTMRRRYWNSSVAYMMSLAIHEGAEEIGLFGIEMKADDEYGYQRPNMEWMIGFAEGMGINVVIPEGSPLCKFQQVGKHVTYTDSYGSID